MRLDRKPVDTSGSLRVWHSLQLMLLLVIVGYIGFSYTGALGRILHKATKHCGAECGPSNQNREGLRPIANINYHLRSSM